MSPEQKAALIKACADAIDDEAETLTALDQAIGDGDHGLNMRRGFQALRDQKDELGALPIGADAAEGGDDAGDEGRRRLGPALRHACSWRWARRRRSSVDGQAVATMLAAGIAAVKARGKADVGEKTMLDVLVPVHEALQAELAAGRDRAALLQALKAKAAAAAEATKELQGDEGSCFLSGRALGRPCRSGRPLERASRRHPLRPVGGDLSRGRTCLHRHRLALAAGRGGHRRHGAPDGGRRGARRLDRRQSRRRARHRRDAILAAIDQVWSEAGVAILVDLGGAETNSEMAIEMLPPERRGKIVICNAPIVEGAVMAATEAAGGGSLEAVRATAEELPP